MPSWLPGDDYMTNFKVGDPYVSIDDGYARLPGAGYEALHPELKGVDPEEYPDIHKLRILADVAPTPGVSVLRHNKNLAHARAGVPPYIWLPAPHARARTSISAGTPQQGTFSAPVVATQPSSDFVR